ncbi:unnamed protein product [Vicia faba]|uniref:Uncharacterized protein n=1 Tax=Vicia faba TaxID=3906 RepID=A0AAV0ZYE8_VICFA|nr:unnamed protein product [Vicia faba]
MLHIVDCIDVRYDTLRSLAEEKVRAPKLSEVRAPKLSEAIHAVDHLIELEPEEFELLLLKAHLHSYNEEHELAKEGFELTMKQDPLNAKAYSGLLMENLELKEPMEGFFNRVDEAVKFFEEKKMDSEAREFKLLIAQVKVMEEDYSGCIRKLSKKNRVILDLICVEALFILCLERMMKLRNSLRI